MHAAGRMEAFTRSLLYPTAVAIVDGQTATERLWLTKQSALAAETSPPEERRRIHSGKATRSRSKVSAIEALSAAPVELYQVSQIPFEFFDVNGTLDATARPTDRAEKGNNRIRTALANAFKVESGVLAVLHFLQCTLAAETSVRKRWRAAIKRTIVASAPYLIVAEKVIACWTHLADGTVHTAAGDQASDWRPPTLAERDRHGSWDFVPSGVPPSFGLRDDHSGLSSDDDSDASDAGDDKHIVIANGTFSYTKDWNHIERSRRPTLAAANLLHLARQRTDTSRWWSMRWPSDAVSLVGRSLNLDTGKTYKSMRRLREHSTTYLMKLWQLAVDRAGKRDNVEARRRLQVDWAETKRRLGTHGRNAKRQLMPG